MKLSVRVAKQLVWLGMLVSQLFICTHSVQNSGILSVSILTDPSGPTYSAASWIRVTCQTTDNNDTDTLTYTWIGACNETGDRVFEIVDPYLDSQGQSVVWIPSTPHYCLDYLECHVLDLVKNDKGSASLLIKDIHGVGVAIEDRFLGSIPNNSIIISSKSPVNVLCHSASKSACSGQWYRQGETTSIAGGAASGCTSLLYSYANLTIVREQGTSGIYTCTIENENAVPLSVYVGIYNSLQEFEYQAEHIEVKLDYNTMDEIGGISFSCNTKGLPVTSTTWKKNNFIARGNEIMMEKLDVLIDPYTSSHLSELTKHGANISSLSDSSLTCDVYSNWVVADQSSFGQKRVSGEFVIKKIGDMATLDCVFPPNHNETEWVLPNALLHASTIRSQAPNSALLSFMVMDLLHKTSFFCQASTPKGNYVYKHYMLITYVPEDAMTMEITEHSYINKDSTTDGDHHNISCCVLIGVEGINSAPTVNWYNSRGEMISGGGDFHLQQTVSENLYCTIFQFPSEACGDRLLCRATLLYDADSTPLVQTMRYSINRPIIIDTKEEKQKEMSSQTLVIIGATVTITLVVILTIITTALSCAVISLYKRGRQGGLGSDKQTGKSDEYYQPDNDSIETIEVKK